MKRKQNKIAFFVTLIYWAVSTYFLFSMLYQFENYLPEIIEMISLPGIYLGYSIFLGGTNMIAVAIAQVLSFFILFYLIRIVVQLLWILILAVKRK